MNIKFEYLYRDEGNYKTYGQLVFSNHRHVAVETIYKLILSNLIEGSWFDPDVWQIPRFSFHQLNAFGIDDYLWYEFDDIGITDENGNYPLDISDWLQLLK